jgi:hypothetical protein
VAPDYTRPACERKLTLSPQRTLSGLGTLESGLRPPVIRSRALAGCERRQALPGDARTAAREVPEPR